MQCPQHYAIPSVLYITEAFCYQLINVVNENVKGARGVREGCFVVRCWTPCETWAVCTVLFYIVDVLLFSEITLGVTSLCTVVKCYRIEFFY